MATIASASKRLGTLIDDLLAFSRAARTAMRKSRTNLKTICEGAIGDLSLEEKGRKVQWVIGELPVVSADVALLRQVFENLVSNALKYTRRQEHPRIEIGSRRAKAELIVYVRDNGAGFNMRYARKLFNAFQRLHPHSEFEGTGIGLANVRRIIHQHGGRTWAEGHPGQGATFYFSLPFPEEAAP